MFYRLERPIVISGGRQIVVWLTAKVSQEAGLIS